MRRYLPLLLATLAVGCSPVVMQPTPPLLSAAPVQTAQALPVHAPLLDDSPVGLVTRARVRDPFSLPVAVVPPRPVPPAGPNRPRRTHPLTPTVTTVAVQQAVELPTYTVAGIVQGHHGPVALICDKRAVMLVQPGTRLPGAFQVSGISETEVTVVGQGHRFRLPLHPPALPLQTDGSILTQEPVPTGQNVS